MATPTGNPVGTIDGISYEEANGSGEITISEEGAQATRVFYVDWSDAIFFASALTGKKVTDDLQSNPNEYTVPPKAYSSTLPTMVCTSAKIKPLGEPSSTSGYPTYPYAIVTASYSPRSVSGGDDNPEVLATQEMDIGGEFYEFGEFDLFWDSDATQSTGQKAQNRKVVSETSHSFTENNIATNKKAIINARQGKINSAEYQGVAAGRLLYLGASLSRQITTEGREAWQITHKFMERIGATWQKYYRPSTQQYETVYDKDGNEVSTYEEIDFSGLLDEDAY